MQRPTEIERELLGVIRDIWEVVKALTHQMGELVEILAEDDPDILNGWQARLEMVADREEFRA